MADTSEWQRVKAAAPSFGVSLAIHLVLLVVFAMITWIVVSPRSEDRVLSLATEDVVSDEGDTAPGPSGSLGGPAAQVRDLTAQRDLASLQPPAPLPQAMDASIDEMLKVGAATELPAAMADPAGGLIKSLAAASDLPGTGPGTGLLPGTSPGFGEAIIGYRKKGLDVVLVLDATDSMSPYIEQGKKRLKEVVDVVTYLVPKARFGVVAYKDYGDDYTPKAVKVLKITGDYQAIHKFISEITAGGGADEPEPIDEALAAATDRATMAWRGTAKRVIILVGDSSIHPSGRKKAFRHAAEFARGGRGVINVIDVGGAGGQRDAREDPKPDLAQIAESGGGKAFLLRDRSDFWRHLIVSVFGRRYEQDVNTIIEMVTKKK